MSELSSPHGKHASLRNTNTVRITVARTWMSGVNHANL